MLVHIGFVFVGARGIYFIHTHMSMFICCAKLVIQGAFLVISGILFGYVVVCMFLAFGEMCVVNNCDLLAFRGRWVLQPMRGIVVIGFEHVGTVVFDFGLE